MFISTIIILLRQVPTTCVLVKYCHLPCGQDSILVQLFFTGVLSEHFGLIHGTIMDIVCKCTSCGNLLITSKLVRPFVIKFLFIFNIAPVGHIHKTDIKLKLLGFISCTLISFYYLNRCTATSGVGNLRLASHVWLFWS